MSSGKLLCIWDAYDLILQDLLIGLDRIIVDDRVLKDFPKYEDLILVWKEHGLETIGVDKITIHNVDGCVTHERVEGSCIVSTELTLDHKTEERT